MTASDADEVSIAAAAAAAAPKLIHDGDSYQIYFAVLPESTFQDSDINMLLRAGDVGDNALPSSSGPAAAAESGPAPQSRLIKVAIKICKPGGHSDVSNLNNEFNILRLGRMVGCPSTRAALNRESTFDAQDGSGPKSCTAVYFEWVDGLTLADWLKLKAGGKDVDTANAAAISEESARFLDKIRVAHGLADAVANIHEAGVIHNDLDEENIILSLDSNKNKPCKIAIIDFEYADQSQGLEENDAGERVNDDFPRLAALQQSIFRDEGVSTLSELSERISYGISGDFGVFSQTYRNSQSVYGYDDDDRTSIASSDDKTSTTSDEGKTLTTNIVDGGGGTTVDRTAGLGLIEEEREDDASLPHNLPWSVRRMLADIEDHGRGTRETAYRSAREVADDLAQMVSHPAVFVSDPRREDTVKGTFRRPPRKLYGREKELAAISDAFDRLTNENRAQEGRTEVILISGRSGTGKSSLLRQVQSASKGMFVVGKFDQLQSTEPYSALIVALNQVVDSVLAEDPDVIASIRKDILNAVGSNGKLLTNVMPTLIKIIGEQPEVPNVTSIEAQNRFRYIAQCFARALCTPNRPLTIVLDDLQWADNASIDFITTTVTDESNKHFLFIGCCRDDEMGTDHHVSVQLDKMKSADVPFTIIELGNMEEEALNTYVSELLRLPRRLTNSISQIVYRKSLGNAFFATTFLQKCITPARPDPSAAAFCSLQSLADDGLLTFSTSHMRWVWDEAGAEAKSISDDVVEVMAEKIQGLPAGAEDVLKKASCIGAVFDASTVLSLISDAATAAKLDKILATLVKHGLIIKMSRHDSKNYKFSHDRIQQAAYMKHLNQSERAELHLRIGRILREGLYADTPPAGLIFKTVDQLNRGLALIVVRDEQVELAKLNARAGEAAYAACAFAPSMTYTKKCLELLGDEDTAWREHYNLALKMKNLLAELKYCAGDFDGTMLITDCIFRTAKTFDDQLVAQICNVKSSVLMGKLDIAMSASLTILREFGEPLPKKANVGAVLIELIKTKKALRNKTDEYLLSLPEMVDERIIRVMDCLSVSASVAYQLGSDYLAILTFRMTRLILRYGMCDNGSFAFSLCGLMLYAILKDIKGAYRLGQVGVSLTKKACLPKAHTVIYGLINHWRDNVLLTLDPLLNIYQIGLEVGDIEFACYGCAIYSIHWFHSGQYLDALIQQQRTCLQELTKGGRSIQSDFVLPTQQAALNLMGQSVDPVRLNGEAMKEDEIAGTGNAILEFYFHMNSACVAYLFCDYELAVKHSRMIQEKAEKLAGIHAITVQAFYDGLTSFALARITKHRKWRKRGRKMTKKFIAWAKDGPSNNTHKALLLKAEYAALFAIKSKKRRVVAKQAYAAAISTAKDSGFVNDEAIACERAAIFYKDNGEEELFSSHIFRSHHLYLKWGASAKAEHITKAFPGIKFSEEAGGASREDNV